MYEKGAAEVQATSNSPLALGIASMVVRQLAVPV
jgi:hypothetical protein